MKRELAIGDAAEILGLSVDTVRELADSGALTCRRTAGGHRRFSLAAVESFREERASGGRGEAPVARAPQATPPRAPVHPDEDLEGDEFDDAPWFWTASHAEDESEVPSGGEEAPDPEPVRARAAHLPNAREPDSPEDRSRLALLRQYGLIFMPRGVPRAIESEIRDTLYEYVTAQRFPASRPLYDASAAIQAKVEAMLEPDPNEAPAEQRLDDLIEQGQVRALRATRRWDPDDRAGARDEVLGALEDRVDDEWSEHDVADLVDEILADWETVDEEEEEEEEDEEEDW